MADVFDFYVYDDRSIRFAIAEPIMLEDKDVTQFRFRIPKSLNGFDMSDWEWWFIFVNPKGTKYTTLLELTDDEDEPDNYSVATYTVGYGFSGIVGTVRFSIEALNVSGEEIVNEWHTKTYSTAVIDTLQGLRAVIPEPDGHAASGLTQQEKNLILQLFSKAAYAESDASTAYNALEVLWAVTTRTVTYNLSHVTSNNTASSVESGNRYTTTLTAADNYSINSVTVTMGGVDVTATYYNSGTITIPSVTGNIVITATAVLEVSSLSAVYTQSGTVYDTDTLDSLKPDLVVTAYYDNQTSAVVTNYTLSGTLTEGTSTITVEYAGLTDTFDVVVTDPDAPIVVDVQSMLTATGYYYDGYADTYAKSTHKGTSLDGSTTPAYAIEIVSGRTYTVKTIHSGDASAAYLPVAFSGSTDGTSAISPSNLPQRKNIKNISAIMANDMVTEITSGIYQHEWTFTAQNNAYMSVGCLNNYLTYAYVAYTQ